MLQQASRQNKVKKDSSTKNFATSYLNEEKMLNTPMSPYIDASLVCVH
jgi:hypothetical protein